jgi:uncharacterized protein DUF3540
VLSVPHDLALVAEGNIDLVAGGRIRGVATEIDLQGVRSASLGANAGTSRAGLRVDPKRVVVGGEELDIAADTAAVRVGRARYLGDRLETTVQHVAQVFGKVESVVERLVARAGNVFHEVDELHQLKAGRLRTLVRGLVHMKGGDVSIKATDDVNVDGKRINLG